MDRTSNKFYPTTSTPDSSPVALGEMHWSNGSQIHPGGGVVAHPSAGLGGIAGGGRFRSPTRISRSLKFALSGGAAGERGLVALAKPRENGEGRVAVVGKSCSSPLLPSSPLEVITVDQFVFFAPLSSSQSS